jgi:hypothetical protein
MIETSSAACGLGLAGLAFLDAFERDVLLRSLRSSGLLKDESISTIERAVPFDILEFYRGQRTYVGVDTLALDSVEGATILDSLASSFESGALKPFPIVANHVFPLGKAADAYRIVFNGAQHRVLLKP